MNLSGPSSFEVAKLVLAGLAALALTLAFASAAPAASQGAWELPASDLSAPSGSAGQVQVAVAADGTVTAVWRRFNGAHEIIQAATRQQGGSFAAPLDLSETGQGAGEPQIAVAPDGTATAVWRRFSGSNHIIQAATRQPGGSFGLAANLSTAGVNSFKPQIAVGPDGTATTVWTRGTMLIQAATRAPASSFGTVADLSSEVSDTDNPQVAAGPDGTTIAVWKGPGFADTFTWAAIRLPGDPFGAGVEISDPGGTAIQPQIAFASDGSATAVWSRFDGSNNIIQAATRPPGGFFGTPVNLSSTGQSAFAPQVAFAPDGTATVVWYRFDGSADVIQAATRPPGGAFGTPVDLSVVGGDAREPQIAFAPDGTATAVWRRWNGSRDIVQASTRPPGGSFGAPVDLSDVGGDADQPQIVVAADGVATAVWRWLAGGEYVMQFASTSQPSYLLEVQRGGSGAGTVTSSPAGIDCGATCSGAFVSGTVVTLTATPGSNSTFTGFSGACSGTGSCQVTMDEAKSVTATFTENPPPARARISKVTVRGPAKVKRGRTAAYRMAITNSGNIAARNVRIRVGGRGIAVNNAVGQVAAGKTRTVTIRIRPRLLGKVRATFRVSSANAGGKIVRRTVRVVR